jgi:nitrate/nitrite-specific signal transduction histidine kinase
MMRTATREELARQKKSPKVEKPLDTICDLLNAANLGLFFGLHQSNSASAAGHKKHQPASNAAEASEAQGKPASDSSFNWLTRELHDGVLQNLIYLDLELSALEHKVAKRAKPLDDRLPTIQKVVKESIKDLRGTLGLLRSGRPGAATLQARLTDRVDSFKSKTGLPIKLHFSNCNGQIMVSTSVGHHIDFIVQEALCNAWRHGQSSQVEVMVQGKSQGVVITITDNGRGFDPHRVPEGHFGLRIMKDRASAIGGTLDITSAEGQGSTVKLQVPWRWLTQEATS